MMSNLKFNEELRRLEPLEHLRIVLRGAGQVMFQPSAWSGLFFMVGIFWGAYSSHTPEVAWGAVLGLLVSTLTGYWIDMPSEDGRQGLWGFNGVLVGCAFPTFLGGAGALLGNDRLGAHGNEQRDGTVEGQFIHLSVRILHVDIHLGSARNELDASRTSARSDTA